MTTELTDRELDERVARTLGLVPFAWSDAPAGPSEDFWWAPPNRASEGGPLKHYSTNIADAWPLFEEMQVYFVLERLPDAPEHERWWCGVVAVEGINMGYFAPAAPRAICLTFVAYVEAKEAQG